MKKSILLITFLSVIYSCDDIIEVVDISEKNISVLAPTNQAALIDNDVTFTWDAIEDASHYKIQIATPNFETAIQIVTDSTISTTFFNRLLDSGSYEWRVRAENSEYATVYATQAFTLLASDPIDISNQMVVMLSPENDATFITTDTVIFSWEGIEGANEYEIQIATPDFDNPVETITDEIITDTSFSVSNLSQNAYKFRVKAKNFNFETGYTEFDFDVNE